MSAVQNIKSPQSRYHNSVMDLLEDQWWPTAVTSSRPFFLPPSSQWLLKQDASVITIVAGGDNATYHVHQSCLPFLMLLDLVQQTYLSLANESAEASHIITFYKGVMFLDSLRRDIMGGLQNREVDPLPLNRSLPESMRRWLCRFILCIPHDPENRRRNSIQLQKAYEEIDVFEFGRPFSHSPRPCYALTTHSNSRLLRLVADSRRAPSQLSGQSLQWNAWTGTLSP
jgi:hypothetical protein